MSDKQQQLTVINPAPVAATEQAIQNSPMNLLALAIKQGIPLGELVAMNEKWEAKQAKAAYDTAMAEFQAECPTIYKTKDGARTKPVGTEKEGRVGYKYAAFEDIIAIVKPLLKKHGFTFQLGTDVESKDNWVIATCKVTHSGGHSETSEAKFPLGAGTQLMSTTQVYAAALSFASRRVFMNSLGLVAAGEDMDGRLPDQKPRDLGPSKIGNMRTLRKELWDALIDIRGQENNTKAATTWLKHVGIMQPDEKWDEMDPARLIEVIEAARAQLQKEA